MNVSAADICFWGLDTTTSHQAVALYHLLESTPDKTALEQRLRSAIKLFPKLSMRRADKPSSRWQQIENHDLDDHLQFRVASSADNNFRDAIAEEFSSPLLLNKPLWRMVVLSHPSTTKCALLFTVHHSMADGMSGMALFYALCDSNPEWDSEIPQKSLRTFRRAASWKETHSLSGYRRLLQDGLRPAPTHDLRGQNSTHRRLLITNFTISDTQQYRLKHKATINEIFLLCITAGLRQYFLSKQNTPPPCSALIPVNLRTTGDITALGNHLTAVRVALPVEKSCINEQRTLLQVELQRIQEDGSFSAYARLSSILAKLPWFVRNSLLHKSSKKIDCICTNAPAPKSIRWIAGAKILETYGIPALMPGQALGFAAVRYGHQLHLSLVHDPAILQDASPILAGINQCMQHIAETTKEETRRKANSSGID